MLFASSAACSPRNENLQVAMMEIREVAIAGERR